MQIILITKNSTVVEHKGKYMPFAHARSTEWNEQHLREIEADIEGGTRYGSFTLEQFKEKYKREIRLEKLKHLK